MTKQEKTLIDNMFRSIYKHKGRRLVNAKIFNRKAKPGYQLVVIPVQDLIKEHKKLVSRVKKMEKKNV